MRRWLARFDRLIETRPAQVILIAIMTVGLIAAWMSGDYVAVAIILSGYVVGHVFGRHF